MKLRSGKMTQTLTIPSHQNGRGGVRGSENSDICNTGSGGGPSEVDSSRDSDKLESWAPFVTSNADISLWHRKKGRLQRNASTNEQTLVHYGDSLSTLTSLSKVESFGSTLAFEKSVGSVSTSLSSESIGCCHGFVEKHTSGLEESISSSLSVDVFLDSMRARLGLWFWRRLVVDLICCVL